MRNYLVPVFACALSFMCTSNDRVPTKPGASIFHALTITPISIKDYLDRIAKYSGCSQESFILALIYMDRVIETCPTTFIVNSYSIHRLIITSVLVAVKFFDDEFYNSDYYARVGGISCSEMNALEIEFLSMIDFDLFVTPELYQHYCDQLRDHASDPPCKCTKNLKEAEFVKKNKTPSDSRERDFSPSFKKTVGNKRCKMNPSAQVFISKKTV